MPTLNLLKVNFIAKPSECIAQGVIFGHGGSMLILTRKPNSSITITNIYDENGQQLQDIEINVYSDNRIGIVADGSVDIYRSEILELGE